MSGSIFSNASSLSDLLTTLKNGVVAVNTLSNYLASRINMGRGAMALAYTTLYTVQPNNNVVLTNIDICNTDAAPAQVWVSIVSPGGTAGASNALIYGANVPANSLMQWQGAMPMAPGETVQCYATATTCTIMASGSGG